MEHFLLKYDLGLIESMFSLEEEKELISQIIAMENSFF